MSRRDTQTRKCDECGGEESGIGFRNWFSLSVPGRSDVLHDFCSIICLCSWLEKWRATKKGRKRK